MLPDLFSVVGTAGGFKYGNGLIDELTGIPAHLRVLTDKSVCAVVQGTDGVDADVDKELAYHGILGIGGNDSFKTASLNRTETESSRFFASGACGWSAPIVVTPEPA